MDPIKYLYQLTPCFSDLLTLYCPMAERWNQGGYSIAVRLGHMAVRAQGLIVAQRIQSIQRMIKAHTKDLLLIPGGKRKLAEAQTYADRLKHLIKDDPRRG